MTEVTEVLLVNSTVRIPSAPQAGHRESPQTISVLTLSGPGAITCNRCRCCEDVTVFPSQFSSPTGPAPTGLHFEPAHVRSNGIHTLVASSTFIPCRFHPSRDSRSSTPQRHDRSPLDRREQLPHTRGEREGRTLWFCVKCSNTQTINSGITEH